MESYSSLLEPLQEAVTDPDDVVALLLHNTSTKLADYYREILRANSQQDKANEVQIVAERIVGYSLDPNRKEREFLSEEGANTTCAKSFEEDQEPLNKTKVRLFLFNDLLLITKKIKVLIGVSFLPLT